MIKKELVAHKDPKSPVSETFRTLRTNILSRENDVENIKKIAYLRTLGIKD